MLYSGATYQDASSGTSAVAAGTVAVSNTAAGKAVVESAGLQPGAVRQASVEIQNAGDVAAGMTLIPSGLSGGPLAAVLELRVEEGGGKGGSPVWNGKLAALAEASLGTFASGERRTYVVTLTWPSTERDPGLQGLTASLTMRWRGQS